MKKKAKILVVEDERITAEDIQKSLQNLGYCVSGVVPSGEEVLKKIEDLKPDLVLMDIVLKGEMDGIETADQIHSQFNIPVIYVTTYFDEKRMERAKKTEPFGYIIKPFEEEKLHGVIEMALYKHRMEMQLRESEGKYRALIETTNTGYHILDMEGRILDANTEFIKLLGYNTLNDISGHSVLEWTAKYDVERNAREIKKCIKKGFVRNLEIDYVSKNDRIIPVEINANIVETQEGLRILGLIRDITERRQKEKIQSTLYNIAKAVNITSDLNDLFTSIRRYLNEIIDTTNFVIGLYDDKRDELSVTYKVDKKDKYTSFPLGKTLTAYVIRTGESLLATEKVMDELTRTGKVKMIGTPSKIWLGVPLKIGKSVVGVITVQSYEDASHYTKKDLELLEFVSAQIAAAIERKRAAEVLKNSEQEKRTILDSLMEHVVHEDKNMKILWANRAACESVNLTREELVGRYCYEIWPRRKDPCPDCPVIKAMETGQPQEVEKATPDGRVWFIRGYPERDKDGKVIGGIEVTLDITQRKLTERAIKRAEMTLKKSEEKYRKLFEGAMDAIFLADAETGILIDCNSAASKLIGRKRSELVGKHQSILHPPERIEGGFTRTFKQHLKEKQGEVLETQVITKNGEIKDVAIKASIFEIEGKKVLLGIFEDITERKRAEADLRESEEKYRVSIESAPYGIAVHNRNGKFLIFNSQLEKITGYSREEIPDIHTWLEKGYPEKGYRKSVIRQRETITVQKSPRIRESVIVRKDGEKRTCQFVSHRLPSGMGTIFVNDITERNRAEERVQKDLKEKKVLLKEIHHRVKNNLQVISSLLSLQSDYIKDKEALQMFKESRDRVRSMALVHEKLYGSKDLARIDFEGYIKSLVHDLYRVYGTDPKKIGVRFDVKNVHLGIDLAVPCGLIVNELISNALKHAFPPSWGKKGKIEVSLRPTDGGEIELIVRDNGVGLPKDLDIRKTESLGMHLVTILAEGQLHGKIKLDRRRGTKFQIRFKTNAGSSL